MSIKIKMCLLIIMSFAVVGCKNTTIIFSDEGGSEVQEVQVFFTLNNLNSDISTIKKDDNGKFSANIDYPKGEDIIVTAQVSGKCNSILYYTSVMRASDTVQTEITFGQRLGNAECNTNITFSDGATNIGQVVLYYKDEYNETIVHAITPDQDGDLVSHIDYPETDAFVQAIVLNSRNEVHYYTYLNRKMDDISSPIIFISPVDNQAKISWSIPVARENGDELHVDEIGGYELFVKPKGTSKIENFIIPDGSQTSFTVFFSDLSIETKEIEFDFSLSAFDTDGFYSDPSNSVFKTLGVNVPSLPWGPDIVREYDEKNNNNIILI